VWCGCQFAESANGQILKSVNIWQSYQQERGCFLQFERMVTTLLKVEETARHNPPFPVTMPNIHQLTNSKEEED